MSGPFNPAAERNKAPILAAMTPYLGAAREILEIGAGSGQHAAHFATELNHLRWQASEQLENLVGLAFNLAQCALPNLPPPLALDVLRQPWPIARCDAVYAANVVQCMTSAAVEALFSGVVTVLARDGCFLLYGPFNREGRYTSEGNARLDAWARGLHPDFGLRDRAALEVLAGRVGLRLCEDRVLPANNQLLVWRHLDG